MENVTWLKLKLNEKMMNLQSSKANINVNLSSDNSIAKNLVQQTQNKIINEVQNQVMNPQQLRMNNLASIDRAVYVKNLLNLPKNMVELLVKVQNEGKTQTAQNNQQQVNNPQQPQNLPQTNQQQINNNPTLPQNNTNTPVNNQPFAQNSNPQTAAQQANIPTQNQTVTQKPVTQVNQQVQLPEQPEVQNQNQQVKEQKQNTQQQHPQQQASEKSDTLPQKQISADKEAFTQQLNNAKQNTTIQKPETQVQNQLQQQPNKPNIQPQQNIKPDNIPQQTVSNKLQVTQQQTADNRQQVQQPVMPDNKPAIQQPQQQLAPQRPDNQPQQPVTNNRPQIPQPQIQQPAIPGNKPIVQQPQQQPVNNKPDIIPQDNKNPQIPRNEHNRQIQPHNNDVIRPNINHETKNHAIENRPQQNNIPRTENNPKQEIQFNRPVLDKGENFIQNTKQNIQQHALNNPHNQLHNNIRNHIRQPIIHQPPPPAQELDEQMQNMQKTQGMTAEELAKFKQNMASQLSENVNLSNVSALLQRNSKLAMNKMVSMMTIATAQGMTDIKPLQDTVNIINASVSANSQNDATQTLKNLMLLYLPWLPLQEGVGFDLEIEQDEDIPESDTFIKILITTVNFGNLHATVSLITGNSVDIAITCSEKFPKKELFKRLLKDGSQHSMQTAIDIKEQKPQEQIDTINPKAKVNLANVNQVNPYLLLMSHAIIRHTIELDATVSIGNQPIDND